MRIEINQDDLLPRPKLQCTINNWNGQGWTNKGRSQVRESIIVSTRFVMCVT